MKKGLFVLLFLLILTFALAGCEAVSITKTEINDDLHLIITYSDGKTEDKGYVGQEVPGVTIKKTEINADKHLIITYSDGTTEDKGYVGVEVIPPLYTVTFVDKDGNTIATQEVYKGADANAPTAPDVADMSFMGWDRAFTNVQGNLTVKATYSAAATYTVRFLGENGAVLKTESVIHGHDATAPTPPKRENTVFANWDKPFTNITGNLDVKAVYRNKNNYTVTFKDYSGRVLKTETVKEGDNANAPTAPTREGYTFTGWSQAVTNITASKTVTANYKLNSGNNIVDLSYTLNGNQLQVVVAVKGTVKFCGMEGTVAIPTGLTYTTLTAGDGCVANYVAAERKVYYTFTSATAKDITNETVLLTLNLTVNSGTSEATFGVEVSDIYDQGFSSVGYTVIGKKITVK